MCAGGGSSSGRVQVVERTILGMCACGFVASIVAISQLSAWPVVSREDHSGEPDFAKTRAAFILGLVASAASLAIGLARLKYEGAGRSKSVRLTFVSCLLASFLCLLVAVAVWGDFVNHGDRDGSHSNHLDWSYWVAVVADIFQFLAFLLYIIRSDFKSDEFDVEKQ